MAYIGNQPTDNFVTFATQNFSTSATSSYTLSHAVSNENEIALFINNVRQHPGSGKAYTASGTALTLSANTASTDVMYCIFLGRAIQSTVPATNSITAAMVGNDLVSGKDALAAEPADTDEFLVSDAGVLKRIDYSLIKGGGITVASNWRPTATTSGATTDITSWEKADHAGAGYIGSDMTVSSGVFTFPSTGTYLIMFRAQIRNTGAASLYNGFRIRTTVDNSSYISASYGYTANHAANAYTAAQLNTIFNVTDTSTHKVKFGTDSVQTGTITLIGGSSANESEVIFIRLGDST